MLLFPVLSSAASLCPKLASFVLPLAQAADDTVTQQSTNPVVGAVAGLFGLVFAVIAVVSMWKVFTKAGQPGWASIVPIYNLYILCKLAGKPGWWLLLMLVPFVNFVIIILLFVALANSFGKGTGFGLGLAFLGIIFLPILAFGDARYQGAGTPGTLAGTPAVLA